MCYNYRLDYHIGVLVLLSLKFNKELMCVKFPS